AILHWNQNHYVVLYKISADLKRFYISDPAFGKKVMSRDEFMRCWGVKDCGSDCVKGIVLMLEPLPRAAAIHAEYVSTHPDSTKVSSWFGELRKHLREYRKHFGFIILLLFVGSLLQLIMPFLTKAIVDRGIHDSDLNIIYLILIGEGMIVVGSTITEFLSRWLTLHVSVGLNIRLKKDFINRLFYLPMRFFDSRKLGDSLRRMEDNKRVQTFLTSEAVSISFVVLSAVVLGVTLAWFSPRLFLIFLGFSLLYGIWVCLFLRRRKCIDYQIFEVESDNQHCTYQLLSSMQETKLQGCEARRRDEWEIIQQRLYRVQMKNLRLQQSQESGSVLINELKNIIITVLAASGVIAGKLSLGDMLAIQFIIGQLNNPVSRIISFIYSLQDLKISMERINEVKNMDKEDRDVAGGEDVSSEASHDPECDKEREDTSRIIENEKGCTARNEGVEIAVNNLTYRYNRFSPIKALDGVTTVFPKGRTTAIVGASGSGKSTLLKLMLGYYRQEGGEILINGKDLSTMSMKEWRKRCGVVMQEGFIYNDTIERNIVMDEGEIDYENLRESMRIANISDEVDRLPLKTATVIGSSGRGLSLGQKQRLLIARAIYRKPEVILFDEATNSLDSVNERMIVENLEAMFEGRTVIVIAHRLSTVRNADNILVMDRGRIVDSGTFESLKTTSKVFYDLVKNQLEL
ncbi:MAG: peptidase domain-containing ABC transporter, partial [Muribaculaceae bacterium]|nr:peptidase domain-containing ABC transporter [Muribaculaceae bacterium]